MVTDKIAGHTVTYYDDPEDMPVKRWHKYNLYMMLSGDLGSSIDELSASVQRIGKLVKEKPDDAMILLNNMVISMYNIKNETTPRHYAIAALVKTINGKEYDDLTDEGLKIIVDMLQMENVSVLKEKAYNVKKKIDSVLNDYFPGMYQKSAGKEDEYFDLIVQRSMEVLKEVTEDIDNSEAIARIDAQIASFYRPRSYAGDKAADIVYDLNFRKDCQALKDHMGADADNMTVMEYLTAWEYLKAKSQKQKRTR